MSSQPSSSGSKASRATKMKEFRRTKLSELSQVAETPGPSLVTTSLDTVDLNERDNKVHIYSNINQIISETLIAHAKENN